MVKQRKSGANQLKALTSIEALLAEAKPARPSPHPDPFVARDALRTALRCDYSIVEQAFEHPWIQAPLKAIVTHCAVDITYLSFIDVKNELAARIHLKPNSHGLKKSDLQSRAEIIFGEHGYFHAVITQQRPTKQRAEELLSPAIQELGRRATRLREAHTRSP